MHSIHIRQSTLFFKEIILELILMVKIESINFLLKNWHFSIDIAKISDIL